MADYSTLFDKLEGLTDLETAFLLCIIAREHCIIDTEKDAIEDLENELILVGDGSDASLLLILLKEVFRLRRISLGYHTLPFAAVRTCPWRSSTMQSYPEINGMLFPRSVGITHP